MLSKTSMHALRAVIFIAQQRRNAPVGAAEIARRLGLPPNYLAKTLSRLARDGVLYSTRGRTGGFSLARPASQIAIADLVDTPKSEELRDCLLGGPCQPGTPCVAHHAWTRWEDQQRALMERTRVSDFLGPSAGAEALRRSPQALRGLVRRTG